MTEVTTGDALKEISKKSLDPGDRGGLAKVEVVKQATQAGGIDETVDCLRQAALRGIATPCLTVFFELLRSHAPVAAIAVEKEIGTQLEVEFVQVKIGGSGQALAKPGEAIVVSEDVVDLQFGEFFPKFIEPLDGGIDALFLGAEMAPPKVKSVAVQNEKVGGVELVLKPGEEFPTIGTTCEKVEVGDDEAGHFKEAWLEVLRWRSWGWLCLLRLS